MNKFNVCIVFYTLRGDISVTKAAGSASSFCIVCYTLRGDISLTELVGREGPHYAFVLCFTRFEAISVSQNWLDLCLQDVI